MAASTPQGSTSPSSAWGWLSLYAALGALVALAFVSLGWLLLGPVIVVIVVLKRVAPTSGRSAIGVAAGAGLVLGCLGVLRSNLPYGLPFVGMGVSLLLIGLLEQTRRTSFSS
jgi:hypothetical protein